MHRRCWWESQKERDHKEDLDIGGRMTEMGQRERERGCGGGDQWGGCEHGNKTVCTIKC
jgi:hypothetical protein